MAVVNFLDLIFRRFSEKKSFFFRKNIFYIFFQKSKPEKIRQFRGALIDSQNSEMFRFWPETLKNPPKRPFLGRKSTTHMGLFGVLRL